MEGSVEVKVPTEAEEVRIQKATAGSTFGHRVLIGGNNGLTISSLVGLSSSPLLFFLVCSVPSAFISLFSHVQTEFPSFWYDFWRALHPPTGVLREPPCSVAASPFPRHTMTSVNI